ncbi:MAG: Nif3-like dinuclear metal center hexameric protein [Acidobacteria bacterium]|nr:Nif3-like dinuclear metal center hexameric protein [Acidobacteriota bacterium]
MHRRVFLASVLPAFARPADPLTAAEVVARIQKQVAVPWREGQTVDTIKTSNPNQTVKGIATSFTSTMEVLEKAAAKGLNMIIVHEPTFYNHEDKRDGLEGAVYNAKTAFLEKNGMVVMRFHDHWHARRPDGIQTGMVATLGWEKYRDSANPRRFVFPAASLEAFTAGIAKHMGIQTMRVIGDRKQQVRNVVLAPGYATLQGVMRTLERDDVDAMVIGEAREWEGVEYARDAVRMGRKKALIILGHSMSEDGGMKECAAWLKTFIPEVPVEFIASGEPFWRP